MATTNNTMMFRTGVNDALNKPTLVMLLEAETGKPARLTIMTREGDPEFVVIIPPEASMNLSSAFGLVASMEQGQMKDDVLRPDGLGD
jgi:hypothetical protein